MKNDFKKIKKLLHINGFNLIRDANHFVYRNQKGQNFVIAKTSSCYHAEQNNIKTLRKICGNGFKSE